MTYRHAIRRWLVLAGLLVAASAPSPHLLGGQEGPLGLQTCIDLALERNPLVLASENQVQAAVARVRQAWSLPQPSLDIDSDLQPGVTDFDDYGERYVGISQTIPFPLRLYVDGQIARQESNQVLADRDLVKLDLTFQVTEAFYGLLLAAELAGYSQQNLELAQDFVTMTEAKFQAGDVPRVEVVRAGLEAARAANDARMAEAQVRLARARLNVLLARAPSEPLELEGELLIAPLSTELGALQAMALDSRPEIRRVDASLERESYQKTSGFLSYLPDLDLGTARHTIPGERDTWDVTLSVSLPLYFWQPARGAVAEADANLRALQEEKNHLEHSIRLEVEENHANLALAGEQIRVFQSEILPQAEEAYEMYLFAYQQGEITALDLIEARRTLNDARTSFADALFTYDLARAGLERSVGRPLQEQDNGPDSMEPAPGLGGPRDAGPGGLQSRLRFQWRNRHLRPGGGRL